MKILMVCLGNICRSPLAEGILKSKVASNPTIHVESAGTANFHVGDHPDARAIAIAREHHVDISKHRGQQFCINHFDQFDRIYVMDASNYADVISLARNDDDRKKVDFILNQVAPGKNQSVPDPYYGGADNFKQVYVILNHACEKIASELSTL